MIEILKTLFGMDPVLLDAAERTKKMNEVTINGESEWLLICRPKSEEDIVEKIECSDRNVYIKQELVKRRDRA